MHIVLICRYSIMGLKATERGGVITIFALETV